MILLITRVSFITSIDHSNKNLEILKMKLGILLSELFVMTSADLIGWNRGINNYSRFGEARTSQINDLRYQLMVQAKDHPETLQKMMELLKNNQVRRKRSTANKTERTKFQRFRNFHLWDFMYHRTKYLIKSIWNIFFIYWTFFDQNFVMVRKSVIWELVYKSSSSRLSRSGNDKKNSKTDILPSRFISPPVQGSWESQISGWKNFLRFDPSPLRNSPAFLKCSISCAQK